MMTEPVIEEDIWDPNARFSLSVREITSVSATFILSADPSLSDFSWDENEEDMLSMPGGPLTASGSQYTSKPDRVIPDALAKGLSVLVNGQPWQRVLMRVDDTADEAIVIIYGLMPGRRYDIELGVAPGDESIRGQVTTEQNTHPDLSPVDGDSSPEEDESTLAGSADSSPSANTNPLPLAPTVEERVQQFQHSLLQLTEERNTLTASLKSTRRDAQKTDAALRADIEGLKRASEKQAAGEHRARQKILALQEAVKQVTAATATTEEEVAQIERELPSLKAALEAKEREHERSRLEADKIRAEREHAEADARRRTDASKAEVSSVANRLERLTIRREKLETGVIADLEEQLRAVRDEMEQIESDPFEYLCRLDEEQNIATATAPDELGEASVVAIPGHPLARQSPNLTRQFGMSPGPIQRPHSQGTLPRTAQPVSPSPRAKDAAATRRTRQAPSTLAAAAGSKPANSSSLSTLRPAASGHITSQANTTLSSRATPFEPRRGAATALNPASTAFEPKTILVNPNRAKVASRAV